MGQTGGVDIMTQSALKSVLQQVRVSALLYEGAAPRHGKAFPFAKLAQDERRYELLFLGLLKRYAISAPPPPKASPAARSLTEVLRQSVAQEKRLVSECSHYLNFVKPQDIRDALMIVRATARERHLPVLQKKLGPEGPPHLTPEQVRQVREKVDKGR
jgi:hypothetical protein